MHQGSLHSARIFQFTNAHENSAAACFLFTFRCADSRRNVISLSVTSKRWTEENSNFQINCCQPRTRKPPIQSAKREWGSGSRDLDLVVFGPELLFNLQGSIRLL